MTEHATYPWLAHYPQNIPWDAKLAAKPVYALLDDAETRFPSRPALDFLGRVMTFSDLAERVRRMAASLQELGVNKGTRVGLFLPNCPQFVISYYAILKAGGTVVNFNPLYADKDVRHQIEDSGAEIMITLSLKTLYAKLAPMLGAGKFTRLIVSDFQEGLPFLKGLLFPFVKKDDIATVAWDNRHIRFTSLLSGKHALQPVALDPADDVAVLQYTGGTTGLPKAAMLTHANIYCNALQSGLWFTGLKPGEERVMGVLPLFHVFAMTAVMNLSISQGAMMILHPRFELKATLEDIAQKKPTLVPGVPTMFAAINNYKSLGDYNLTSIKMCISGGAPLPLDVKQKFQKLTNCILVEGYGLTESSPVAACNPLFGVNKEGSIGLPFPDTILEIVSLEDHMTPMPQGEIGEICIRGPQVMKGYWNQPEETANVLRGDRLHTGDIGSMDEDGYFFVVDRLKEMILCGGFNVYPRNIEEEIYKHPDVAEAAVVGLDSALRGQIIKAFVVLKENCTLKEVELKQFLKDKLVSYALPSKIEFRASLPKTMIGKIAKKELVAEELAKKQHTKEDA